MGSIQEGDLLTEPCRSPPGVTAALGGGRNHPPNGYCVTLGLARGRSARLLFRFIISLLGGRGDGRSLHHCTNGIGISDPITLGHPCSTDGGAHDSCPVGASAQRSRGACSDSHGQDEGGCNGSVRNTEGRPNDVMKLHQSTHNHSLQNGSELLGPCTRTSYVIWSTCKMRETVHA